MFCLAILVSLTACGGGGGSSSESSADQSTTSSQESASHQAINQSSIDSQTLTPAVNENIVIKVVADNENSTFYGAYVEWKESNTDTPEEFTDAILIDEDNSEWMIDQFPEGIITVKATKYAAWEDDPSCHYFYEGTTYVDTAIDEVQEIKILIEQLPSVCE